VCDIHGLAPCTHETDTLDTNSLVEYVHGIVLTGGVRMG